jgi:hypothetical protein
MFYDRLPTHFHLNILSGNNNTAFNFTIIIIIIIIVIINTVVKHMNKWI